MNSRLTRCPVCLSGEPAFACKAILYPGCERDILLCPRCAAAYYWPVPSLEEVARCYPHAYYFDFFKQYWKDYYKGRMLARELAAWKKEGVLLDVGCALGTLLAGARDYSSWKVLGLEFSPWAAQTGRELNKVEIASVGDLSGAPWPAESVDFIHMNNVLEHERDGEAALAAAARLLRPKGRLRLVVPNGPVDLRSTKDLYFKWKRAVVTRHGGHLFFYSKKSLAILLKRLGFRPLSIKNFHFQTGLKARGLKPGAYKIFKRMPEAPSPDGIAPPSLEECKRAIPPQPSWPSYFLSSKWRGFWRWEGLEYGYDFDVLAEKI